ncbi:hypothetical protein F5X99DRAFT_339426 [Biscogniauxia marginata]|nr:hypothetical protein F5X99DRAFT_339426 [Biscogniauxia marginata]
MIWKTFGHTSKTSATLILTCMCAYKVTTVPYEYHRGRHRKATRCAQESREIVENRDLYRLICIRQSLLAQCGVWRLATHWARFVSRRRLHHGDDVFYWRAPTKSADQMILMKLSAKSRAWPPSSPTFTYTIIYAHDLIQMVQYFL